jgi:IS1 family transposase
MCYTDYYGAYGDVIPKSKLKQGKAHTYTVESKNSQLRNYAKMLNRRTKCFAKTYKTLNAVIAITIKRINEGFNFNINIS